MLSFAYQMIGRYFVWRIERRVLRSLELCDGQAFLLPGRHGMPRLTPETGMRVCGVLEQRHELFTIVHSTECNCGDPAHASELEFIAVGRNAPLVWNLYCNAMNPWFKDSIATILAKTEPGDFDTAGWLAAMISEVEKLRAAMVERWGTQLLPFKPHPDLLATVGLPTVD